MAKNPNQTTLTIGLELEMVVQSPSPSTEERINFYIAQHLREGLSVTFTDLFEPSPSLYYAPATYVGTAKPMLVTVSPSCETPVVDWIGDHPNPRHFFVTSKPDCLRGISEEQRPFAAGVEVKTPILRLGSWRSAAKSVLDTLSAVPDIKILFTENCGLHVHIGRRGGFELLHLKGLAKAVVIFEEAIEDAYHPEHRCGVGVGKKLYADSNRYASVSLKGFKTVLEMVRHIEKQDTVSDVRSVICDEDVGHRDFKYNFQSLVELGSVEFRQAQGTLDGKWVGEWVQMLIAFVKASEVVSEALFEKFAEAVDNGEDRLGEFLAWGMEHQGDDEYEGSGCGGDEDHDRNDENRCGYEEPKMGRKERERKLLRLVANLGLQSSEEGDGIICKLQRLHDTGGHFIL